MYIFIDEYTIEPYKGEILKRLVGNKIVKVISNPTEEDLIEFGYKLLDDTAEIPDYDAEHQSINIKYIDRTDKIIKNYEIVNIENTDNIEL